MKKILLSLTICSFLYSCNNSEKEAVKPDVVLINIDSTVKPENDFFDFANGGWIKNNPIPEEQSSWGIGNLVMEENMKRLKEISVKAAENKDKKGSANQMIGDFWSTAMDSTKIEKDGLKPIQSKLDKINNINDLNSLINVVAELKQIGSSTLFSDYVAQDAKNSEAMAYQIYQGGLGLPEREYYFKTDSTTADIREKYIKHIETILTMSGENAISAKAAATNILSLETKLANASRKMEDLRDPYKNYNKISITDLNKKTSNINWTNYLNQLGVKKIDSIIVGQPEFFTTLNALLKTVPLSDWKSYIKFNLINDYAPVLPDSYGLANFNFSKLFSGAKVRKPRWKRVIQME